MKIKLVSIAVLAILFLYSCKTGAQWVKTNGPFGGETISVEAGTNGYLYASMQDIEMFQSDTK